ncbi:MBL fold metallo-hydrolase [Hymenobacter taeanensis]|uniref:MBL fold metallo-hydrolase n=1 Tax=Hymenobacter taeanensis TaxID=2735321 RepID=A0A6M6BC97_9BACT|nr:MULTISPECIES: MBL fold metallo-hydrolase [Hymenobacter]QJX45826.1 MBL fold metallo-hydrolase [Hymenobacter taeanensis]UOQ79669.1 MBL fold metallo-hydrolase [Hymenobacter sp. 5414T-23]
MQVQLIRNATLLLKVAGKTLLIDPMLGARAQYDPLPMAGNNLRYPLVDLPFPAEELPQLVASLDAVLLTHPHPDHWDTVAQQLLPKELPVFCQPADEETLLGQGFTQVRPVEGQLNWEGIQFSRTSGQHGTGEIGKLMGTVSGFVVEAGQQRLYIAGDTIWCDDVTQALDQYQPDAIILNAGAARFAQGDPIVMTAAEVLQVAQHAPQAQVYAVHLEAVPHGTENRATTQAVAEQEGLSSRVHVPADGEWITIQK